MWVKKSAENGVRCKLIFTALSRAKRRRLENTNCKIIKKSNVSARFVLKNNVNKIEGRWHYI